MKLDGCLSDALDLVLLPPTSRPNYELRLSIGNLITSIVCSFSESHLQSGFRTTQSIPLPRDGVKSLLGPNIMARLRDRLYLLLGVEGSIISFDCVSSYELMRGLVNDLMPSSLCICNKTSLHVWARTEVS